MWYFTYQWRVRRALLQFKDIPLRTRRALSLYKVYGNSALLVLTEHLWTEITPFWLSTDNMLYVVNNQDAAFITRSHWLISGKKNYVDLPWCAILYPGYESYAMAPLSQKATPSDPHTAVFAEWSETWLPHGSYGVYEAVRGSHLALTGRFPAGKNTQSHSENTHWLCVTVCCEFGTFSQSHSVFTLCDFPAGLPCAPCNSHIDPIISTKTP